MIYINSKIGARPTCQMRSTRLIGKEEQELPPEVDISFGGRSVPRLTLTWIYLWNFGKKTVLGSQIVDDDPLRFSFEPGDEILKAHIAAVTRKVNKLEVSVPHEAKHNADIRFDFLDPQDGAKIEFLHSSKNRYPKVQGTIRGIPKGFTEVSPLGQNPLDKVFKGVSPLEILLKFFIVIGPATFLLGLLPSDWLLKLIELLESEPETQAEPTTLPVRIAFFVNGALFSMLPIAIFLSRRKRYPEVLDKEVIMSKPSAPYYYKKEGSDTYHWETSCSTNYYPAEGWIKSYEKPGGREQCNECKAK